MASYYVIGYHVIGHHLVGHYLTGPYLIFHLKAGFPFKSGLYLPIKIIS